MLVRKAKSILALVLIFCISFVSGCWSRRELESQAYILALGVDLVAPNRIRLVAQIGLPSAEPKGGEGASFKTIISEGIDMSDALDNMHLGNSKRPDLHHLRVIVFSEELVRDGLWHALDVLRRDVNVRSNVRVAISAEDLGDLLAVKDPLNAQPSLAITNHFDINIQRSGVVEVELLDLVVMLLEPDREIVMPVIEVSNDRFTLGKTAVFKDDKMVKIVDKQHTFGLLLWYSQVRDGVISVPQQGNEEKVVSYRILDSRTKVTPSWDGEKLHVQVFADTVVDVTEIHGQVQEDLENLARSSIAQSMRNVLDLAQQEESDFLNIAVHFRRADPSTWQELQSQWAEILKGANYDIGGIVHIRGQGQIR